MGPTSNVTGAIRDNIYSGMMNTERIIINQGNNAFAADICAQHDGGGYGDWYLPSKWELNEMWEKLADSDGNGTNSGPADPGNLGGFASAFYWSSAEFTSGFAKDQDFSGGNQLLRIKNDFIRVRAVRAF